MSSFLGVTEGEIPCALDKIFSGNLWGFYVCFEDDCLGKTGAGGSPNTPSKCYEIFRDLYVHIGFK